MAASTGALAAERERLEREIEALNRGLPDEAAAIVRAADDLLSSHAQRITELKAKRDAIDTTFGVKAHEHAQQEAWEHAQQQEAWCADLTEADRTVLTALQEAEALFTAAVEKLNAAFNAHDGRRKAANAMRGGLRLTMSIDLSPSEFTRRVVGGLCARLAGLTVCRMNRIGALSLPNWSLYPTSESWASREWRHTAESVRLLIEHARDQ